MIIVTIATTFVVIATGQSLKVNVTGDVFLGAMFPIHHLGDGDTCTTGINDQIGFQNLEALLFALDVVNENVLSELSKCFTQDNE